MRARRLLAAAVAGTALALLPASAASAHPLGNFTTNTADRVEVVAGGVRVLHVVDLAEIPTLQLAQPSAGVDTSGDGTLDDGELAAHAAQECARVRPDLRLTVDGEAAPLTVEQTAARRQPGQAGLATVRVECTLASDQRPERTVAFEDAAAAQRNGWAEVTLSSACGRLSGSDVPVDSPSGLLTGYPEDLLSSPLAVRSASARVTAGGGCGDGGTAAGTVDTVLPRGVDRVTGAFTDFVSRPDLTLGFALAAVLLAVGFGAVHALAPGHGKTVVAAYLVGQRGTRRQALWLGATVTVAHTGSVLVLGALISAAAVAAPQRVIPYTEVVSGLLLAAVGTWLLVPAVRRLRAGGGLRHGHGGHDHGGHDHGGHDHGGQGHGDHDHAHDGDHHEHDHHLPGEADGPPGAAAPTAGGTVALRPAAAVHAHDVHAHDLQADSDHSHGVHAHGGSAHRHAPVPDGPLGWRSLVAMGLAGGLVPSPSALVVLLGATTLGRPWFGVVLVLCYGVGMAVTLTAAGLLLLRAQDLLTRRGWALGQGSRVGRWLPAITAGVVVVVGALLVARGYASGRSLS